jgi:Gryzun, putative trafficking through Golgi
VTPYINDPDLPQYLITYTIENPTSTILSLDILVESSDACGFSGPKQFQTTLLPFTDYTMKLIALPLVADEWVRLPRLAAMDEERLRLVEIVRLTDALKVEGPDLYLRKHFRKLAQI